MKVFEISSGEYEPVDPADRPSKWRPALGIMAIVLTVTTIGMFMNSGAKQGQVLTSHAQQIVAAQDIDCSVCNGLPAPEETECKDQCNQVAQLAKNKRCDACVDICKNKDKLPKCRQDCEAMKACPPSKLVEVVGDYPDKECKIFCAKTFEDDPERQKKCVSNCDQDNGPPCEECKKDCAENGPPKGKTCVQVCAEPCKLFPPVVRADYSVQGCKNFCAQLSSSQGAVDICNRDCDAGNGPKCETCEQKCQVDGPPPSEPCAKLCSQLCGGKKAARIFDVVADYPDSICKEFCGDIFPKDATEAGKCVGRCDADSGPPCAACKKECANNGPDGLDCGKACNKPCTKFPPVMAMADFDVAKCKKLCDRLEPAEAAKKCNEDCDNGKGPKCSYCKEKCDADGPPLNEPCSELCAPYCAPKQLLSMMADFGQGQCKAFCKKELAPDAAAVQTCEQDCDGASGSACAACKRDCPRDGPPKGKTCQGVCSELCGGPPSLSMMADYDGTKCAEYCKSDDPSEPLDECVKKCKGLSGPPCEVCKKMCANRPCTCAGVCPPKKLVARADYGAPLCKEFCEKELAPDRRAVAKCEEDCEGGSGPMCATCKKDCAADGGPPDKSKTCQELCKPPCTRPRVMADYDANNCARYCKADDPSDPLDECVKKCESLQGPPCKICKEMCKDRQCNCNGVCPK